MARTKHVLSSSRRLQPLRPPPPARSRPNMVRRSLIPLILFASLAVRPLLAANIVIVNTDPPGTGLNDPTPVSPVGGNAGTTIGAQRLIVFQQAAAIWGGLLTSTVTIRVSA